MGKVIKYIVVRDTIGTNGRHYRRFMESPAETHACWYAKSRPLKNANTTMYVYEVKGEVPEKKADIIETGELVFKCNIDGVIYDRRKAAKEEPHVETEEAQQEVHPQGELQEADGGMEEAPTPASAMGPVRYYAVLKVAENRKQTKFHFKRKRFLDEDKAIDFARSRLRGGCIEASVFFYDPSAHNINPRDEFETENANLDAKMIKSVLWKTEVFYTDYMGEVDKRTLVHDKLKQAPA